MKSVVRFCLLGLLTLSSFLSSQNEKSAFYKALASDDEAILDKTLSGLESEKASAKNNAYKGTLTMKKAGFAKGVGGKLRMFKKGAALLDSAIQSSPSNTEFRFLRLTIQEHAPGILKYNKQLDEDKQVVISGYNKLNPELKTVIQDYIKDSKVLKESDLK